MEDGPSSTAATYLSCTPTVSPTYPTEVDCHTARTTYLP
jgi:hypothetical protein